MELPPRWLDGSPAEPPFPYECPPVCSEMLTQRDVRVPMRDGVCLCVDIYRPALAERVPALLAIAPYNKELSAPEQVAAMGPQPAWSSLWAGAVEAGDSRYLTARGYAHIVGTSRGSGKSESGGDPSWDYFDLIEWIAVQPWCDGNVGMVGISAYGASQLQAAAQQPPHLKAIFPYDPGPAYREFRDRNPGGVLHTFPLTIEAGSVSHGRSGPPGELPEREQAWWQQACDNPDYAMYHAIRNVLTMKGQKAKIFFQMLVNPYDSPEAVARAEANFAKIRIPTYLGTGWYAHTYKSHFQGAQHWYAGIDAPRKLMFTGMTHLERPFHGFHREIVRWYDHWPKGRPTGIMDEPPVSIFVMGARRWRLAEKWPLPETQWVRYYLDSWERLRTSPFDPSGADGNPRPDGFLEMPPTQTRTLQKLRYLTEPLARDTLVIGPAALNLFAAIDQPDTNWFVVLKDVGPDYGDRSGRPDSMEIPAGLPEREVSRGWLKASHRTLDPARSKPWKPWHCLTRAAQVPVTPGEVTEYSIELMSTANLFRRGHRICMEISSADLPTGIGGNTHVEYMPWHICSSATTVHKIHRDARHPSHLVLPVIPFDPVELGETP